MHPFLFPRLEVIGKYPDSIFKVGQLLVFHPVNNVHFVPSADSDSDLWFTINQDASGSSITHSLNYFDGSNHLFRRMLWHEQRTDAEIYSIKYVQKKETSRVADIDDFQLLEITSFGVFEDWPDNFAKDACKYYVGFDISAPKSRRFNLGHFEPRTEQQYQAYTDNQKQWDDALDQKAAYKEEVMVYNETLLSNEALLRTINSPSAVVDLAYVCKDVHIDGKIEIVSVDDVTGDEQEGIPFNIFFTIFIDQWPVGESGDSFVGFIFAQYDSYNCLKIPFKC